MLPNPRATSLQQTQGIFFWSSPFYNGEEARLRIYLKQRTD